MPRGSKPGERRGGRQRGTPNRTTAEVRSWAKAIFDDKEVQAKTLELARQGKLAPGIYAELLHYAYGKPKETQEHTGAIVIQWQS